MDYAILREGAPVILVECKVARAEPQDGDGQFARLSGAAATVKVSVVTNGTRYRFFRLPRSRINFVLPSATRHARERGGKARETCLVLATLRSHEHRDDDSINSIFGKHRARRSIESPAYWF